MSREECVKCHREVDGPMVARVLGPRLKRNVAHYVEQTVSLVSLRGVMETRLYDAVVVTQFDDKFWKGVESWRKTPESKEITEDEERFIVGVSRKCFCAVMEHNKRKRPGLERRNLSL